MAAENTISQLSVVSAMSEAVVIEPGTRHVQDYINLFFEVAPIDSRFSRTEYKAFYPSSDVKSSNILDFRIQAYQNNNCYNLGEALLVTKIKIVRDAAEGHSSTPGE